MPERNHFFQSGDSSLTWNLTKLAMERVNGMHFSTPTQRGLPKAPNCSSGT